MNWLRLHVSNLCNFKCPNCHVFELGENMMPSQIMSQNVFDEAINQFVQIIQIKNQNEFTVSIYGGESLANKKVIKLGIEKFSKILTNFKINWVVNTNGSLIDEADADFFLKHNVELHVSIDGDEKTHNLSRPTHAGKDTFFKVIAGIEKLVIKKVRIQLNSYMMPTNILHLEEIVDIAKKYSIRQIYLDQFYNEDMVKYDEGFELYRKVFHYAEKNKINIFGPWKKALNRKLHFRNREDDLRSYILVDVNVDGTFYLSNFVESKKKHWNISDLFKLYQDGIINEEIEQLKKSRAIDCSACELNNVCYGEAKEQVYYHINRSADTSISCKFFRSIVNYLSRPVYSFKKENIQFISFYPESDAIELYDSLIAASKSCASFLKKDQVDFICKLVESKEELEVACNEEFAEWVNVATFDKQLIHRGKTPSPAIAHEVSHIYVKNLNLNLPNWFEEGVCEWIEAKGLAGKKNPEGEIILTRLINENNLFKNIKISEFDNRKPKENNFYQISHALVSSIVADKSKDHFLRFLDSSGDFEKQFYQMYDITFTEKVNSFLGESNV